MDDNYNPIQQEPQQPQQNTQPVPPPQPQQQQIVFNPKVMKLCVNCRQPIPKQAKICPSCGAKNKKPLFKKPLFWILIVLVVIIIGVVASSGNSESTTSVEPISASDGTSTKSGEENAAQTDGDQKILPGNAISTDNLKISYISCDANYTGYSEYSAPESGNKVIRAEFTFENISSSDISLDGFDCYADGKKCEDFYGADDYASPTLESVSAGRSFDAVVYYEVPKDTKEIELEFEPDFWSSEKIIFVVK